MRLVSAAESAPTRAPFSAASASSLPDCSGSTAGMAAICARSPSSSACFWSTAPPALIVIVTRRTVTSAAPPAAPKTTPRVASKLFLGSSRGRRLTARIGLVVDPESDGDGERAELILLRGLLRDLEPRQRVGNADGHADQALELAAQAGQMRGSAGEHDLADAQRGGLVLVELERGDELPRERLQLPPGGLARGRELILGEAFGNGDRARERERPLERLGLARRGVERACDCDVQRPASPFEHAGELADAAVRDGKGGTVVADRDRDERTGFRARDGIVRLGDRAQERQGLEVDPD